MRVANLVKSRYKGEFLTVNQWKKKRIRSQRW